MKLYTAATIDEHDVLIAWDKHAHASFNWFICLKFSPTSKHVKEISRMFRILSMQLIWVWKSKCYLSCSSSYFDRNSFGVLQENVKNEVARNLTYLKNQLYIWKKISECDRPTQLNIWWLGHALATLSHIFLCSVLGILITIWYTGIQVCSWIFDMQV